jgi:hypothetical protein
LADADGSIVSPTSTTSSALSFITESNSGASPDRDAVKYRSGLTVGTLFGNRDATRFYEREGFQQEAILLRDTRYCPVS